MRLPKPIYELVPFLLMAIGIVFVALVMSGYEYAPTLSVLLLGLLCIMGGIALLVIRLIYRRQHSKDN